MLIEFLYGFGLSLAYFAVCATGAFLLRRRAAMPGEVFRKILHIILLGSVFLWTYAFSRWWLAAAATALFIAVVYPLLALAERIPGYSKFLTERNPGEIKTSLIVVFIMFTVLICVCWGWLGQKYLVIASVLAWGLGDAAAALVGKRFGAHYIEGRLVEGRKSLEGTLAMFVVSFLTVLAVLIVHSPVKWYGYVPIAAVTAAACAVVELYTKGGMDTLTCPFTAAAVLIPLVYFLRG
jgi:phytol kinase